MFNKKPFISIITLDEPVEFDNIDSLDVDIIVSIIVPEKNYNDCKSLLESGCNQLIHQSVHEKAFFFFNPLLTLVGDIHQHRGG